MAKRLISKKTANKAAGIVTAYAKQQARIKIKSGKKSARAMGKKAKGVASSGFKKLKSLFR